MANIAFDIDGTLTDYHDFVKEKTNDFFKQTGIRCEYSPEEYGGISYPSPIYENLFWKLYHEEYLCRPMIPEAASVIRKLRAQRHKIYFISKRATKGWGRDDDPAFDISMRTLHWLSSQDIPFDGVVCTMCRDKNLWIRKWQIDYMVDDWTFPVDEDLHCELFQLDKPYNQDNQYGTRVPSLTAFCQEVIRL